MRIFRLAALAAILSTCAQGALTTISDTLYQANGEKYTGVIEVSWEAFTTAAGVAVPKNSLRYTITAGVVSLTLEPTEGATPSGTAYTVRYYGTRARFTETWAVPVSATPVTLASVRQSSTLVIYPAQLDQATATNGQCLTWSTAAAKWQPGACDAVTTVAGRTGAVVLAASDISDLGGAAVLDVGTTAGTVAAGDDARITGAQQTSGKDQAGGYVGLDASRNAAMRTTVLGPFTIGAPGAGQEQLPAAAAGNTRWTTVVEDAASSSDCTVGGGTSAALCRSTGSAWVPLGGGGASPCTTYTITEADLTADATTQTIDLVAVDAGTKFTGFSIKEGTQFTGGGVTALTVSIGNKTGTVTEYAPTYALMAVPGDSQYYDSSGIFGSATWAAHTVSAKFTSTTANVSALTAGSVSIYVCKVGL